MKAAKEPHFVDVLIASIFGMLKWFRQFSVFVIALCLVAVAVIIVLRLTAGTGTKPTALPSMYNSVGIPVAGSPFDSRYIRAAVPGVGPQWTSVVRQARQIADPAERIAFVHKFVISNIEYADDTKTYGVNDYWATPSETLARRRGDCEDFAILEMMLLRESGISGANIYLTVGADLVARRDHALLSVVIGNEMWALDQRASAPFPTTSMTDFRPILTLNGSKVWLHGFKKKTTI